MRTMSRRLGSLCLPVLLLLAACADDPRPVQQASDPPAVKYKVGKAYQIDGTWYYPRVDYEYVETGEASWYGNEFHGRPTANGEIFDKNKMTAAHRTLPLPSFVRVTNLANGKSAVLRVNDRGPFARNRIIDVSQQAARQLGFVSQGVAQVRVEILADESRQLASLGQSGRISDAERATAAPVTTVSSAVLAPPSGAASAPIPATAASTPLPQGAMYVQAASFGDYRNAALLAERLGRLGPTRVVTVKVNGQDYHRVLVGPAHDQDSASMLLAHVQRAGLSDARIVRSENLHS